MAKRKVRRHLSARVRETMGTQLKDAPWYVRAIAFVGVPSAIAVFLVYFITTLYSTLTVRIDALNTTMHAQGKTLDALLLHFQQDDEQMWQLVSINQRTCLNTAKTDADRLSCVVARRPQ